MIDSVTVTQKPNMQEQNYVEYIANCEKIADNLIQIVNVKNNKPVNLSYVGRSFGQFKGSILGNPFKIGRDGCREEVLEKYKKWLSKGWSDNPQIRNTLLAMAKQVASGNKLFLGCWCAPQPCHADIIKTTLIHILFIENLI